MSLRPLFLFAFLLPSALCCSRPFNFESGLCIYVDTSSDLTWAKAREICQGNDGDLITLDSHEKMQVLSQYLSTTQQDGLVFWAGGHQTGGSSWKWSKTGQSIKINHLWLQGEPSEAGGTRYTKLVPADRTHGRYYLYAEGTSRKAPGYVCEK